MKLYESDLQTARTHEARELADFPSLSREQLRAVRARASRLRSWYRDHPFIHHIIALGALLGLFALDAWVLLELPEYLPWATQTWQGIVLGGGLAGFLHGYIVYGIVSYSVHEGAAHDLIVQGKGRLANALRLFANHAGRFFLADPVEYRQEHFDHHRHLGSEDDGSFTTFVRLRRLLGSVVPMAPFFTFSDFFPWLPDRYTPSRLLSIGLTLAYVNTFVLLMAPRFGLAYTVVVLFAVGGWISFALDRLRESSEHLFMPLDRTDGTRELGVGLWGMLVGGGPWGQPCHLSHHLAPALPWYQQLMLHRFLKREVLTERQRRAFLLRPVVGYPALLVKLVAENLRGGSPQPRGGAQ
ncbi:MAG: fatty acid desaturase [Persicimonas sp.]